jgi:hypothetical protein
MPQKPKIVLERVPLAVVEKMLEKNLVTAEETVPVKVSARPARPQRARRKVSR